MSEQARLNLVNRGKAGDEFERPASDYKPLHSFKLDKEKSYQQQFADMYFLRLTKLKPTVEQRASEAWRDTVIGGEPAKKVERVLDIRQGELCWVSGTVYMEMALKPNILEDVSKDVCGAAASPTGAYAIARHSWLTVCRDGSRHLYRITSTMPTMGQMP